MKAVTEKNGLNQRGIGLYEKYSVARNDGSSEPGGKHHGDEYFVLNITTDKNAIPALKAYAKSCVNDYPALAADLRAKVVALLPSTFAPVPETTLPAITLEDGTVIPEEVVPAFMVARYYGTVVDGIATVSPDHVPTVDISYYDSVKICADSGLPMITETQMLALTWNAYSQAGNWPSGIVGVGKMYQGLHKGSVDEAQVNDYESDDPEERRWFVLSNGERVYDLAGHLFTHVYNDRDGDPKGLIAKPFAKDSRSLFTVPHKSMEAGTGWRPQLPCDWSGYALIRGGRWYGGGRSGVFRLYSAHPDYGDGSIGVRCTKP